MRVSISTPLKADKGTVTTDNPELLVTIPPVALVGEQDHARFVF